MQKNNSTQVASKGGPTKTSIKRKSGFQQKTRTKFNSFGDVPQLAVITKVGKDEVGPELDNNNLTNNLIDFKQQFMTESNVSICSPTHRVQNILERTSPYEIPLAPNVMKTFIDRLKGQNESNQMI